MLENHAQGQTKFNRQIRVAGLPATRRSARRRPQVKRLIADPNRQITAPPQTLVVFSPVGHTMLLLGDLCPAISIELVRHSQHPDGNKPRQEQPTADLCNKAPKQASHELLRLDLFLRHVHC